MRRVVTGCALLAVLSLAGGCTMSRMPGRATAGVPLENTTWMLVELGGQPARAAGGGAPNLRLDAAQKHATGNTGCNTFGGGYELSGESLRFGALVSTRRACIDPELNRQETAFLRALADTRSWRVNGDTLALGGEAGQLARFAAGAPGAP